ncbi:UDP-N-acetylgalactosamine-undecaprenyl-phosphate N-acetylgalactosaminephosphotransferase [Chryseobacterium aquaeductus]|uniref:UDP-N-acetylgalactosamine-undecaprenyl-phosphate N-acetylgalactosaminephosphotransferase n=1 Tax=Chryseobacterium aquaeductus TaxID=2675056 RepID=A0A9N8MPP4_9FLAO|nr:sugar transferase [Chryseobacterium aquaeductus]CAA7331628.1 UDP-N-acetylgalactosamine-undecaprenyl-phosphate N-acetylgalactosaminephosphotransferase [Chryseobacterium potabilaquae]CAD7811345.1 UDP-N-acetylgalactosamine-undecaprenyl-phosphate N-acetylgalactosaminephosphotransferase [Chryseobacterium aquaeductus]
MKRVEKSLTKPFGTIKESKQVFKITGSVKVCLFINVSDISLKLFSDRKFRKKYKAIVYDSRQSKITVTEYLEKFNIKCIVLETSNITHLHKNIANEIVAARNKGIAVYDAHEFYEYVNKRIPLIRLKTNEYLVDDIFTIGQKQEKFNLKRFIDILVSVLLLPIVIPLIILGFILVKLTSHGSVLFSQERVGKNSKNFTIYKIRTMVSKHSGDFTTKNDLRINGVGKFLRLTKIDELPQLWNILKGDMSLIGPRPERPHFVKISNEENAMFDLRHLIKPGVTGWAQVNLPTATPKDNLEKLEYDLFYIKNYSVFFDVIIVFKTLKIVFTLNSN